jgi:hypothetical protein
MRLAVRGLALMNIAVALASMVLYWSRENLSGFDMEGFVYKLAAAVGFLVALASVAIVLVAMVRRRQFAWLTALIVAWLITSSSVIFAFLLAQDQAYISYWDPPCLDPLQCPPPPLMGQPWEYFLAGPVLVGLVVMLYSLSMRPLTTSHVS